MAPKSLDVAHSGGPAEQKDALRRSMRLVRDGIPTDERERLSILIERALFELPEVSSAGTVMLFSSFGTEVATGGMTRRVLEAGKRLLLPYRTEESAMGAAEVQIGEPLEETGYGPREPTQRIAVNPEEVDLIVAPGLAFDRQGNRLGYGGGSYDRYLARLGDRTKRVGVAFSLQIVDRVPVGPGDERVHMVVTDQESFDVRPVQ